MRNLPLLVSPLTVRVFFAFPLRPVFGQSETNPTHFYGMLVSSTRIPRSHYLVGNHALPASCPVDSFPLA